MSTKNRPGSTHPVAPPIVTLIPSRKAPVSDPVGAIRVVLGGKKSS